jgi:hypothetical protein
MEAKGYQQLTVSSTAVSPTLPTGAQVQLMVIVGETANVRWRDDGTSPTASVGMPLLADQPALAFNGDIARVKFIRQGATDATLNIAYY